MESNLSFFYHAIPVWAVDFKPYPASGLFNMFLALFRDIRHLFGSEIPGIGNKHLQFVGTKRALRVFHILLPPFFLLLRNNMAPIRDVKHSEPGLRVEIDRKIKASNSVIPDLSKF